MNVSVDEEDLAEVEHYDETHPSEKGYVHRPSFREQVSAAASGAATKIFSTAHDINQNLQARHANTEILGRGRAREERGREERGRTSPPVKIVRIRAKPKIKYVVVEERSRPRAPQGYEYYPSKRKSPVKFKPAVQSNPFMPQMNIPNFNTGGMFELPHMPVSGSMKVPKPKTPSKPFDYLAHLNNFPALGRQRR
jgi:hypothetical protein